MDAVFIIFLGLIAVFCFFAPFVMSGVQSDRERQIEKKKNKDERGDGLE